MRDFGEERIKRLLENRPKFTKRAVVTGGMPYGNKELHFGHVGGMFVHADTFARFLKDRIGKDNVIFVSGTDCYGSPILEGFRKKKQEGEIVGDIEDFVKSNYLKQLETLKAFEIEPDLFAASGFGEAKEIHEKMSNEILEKLYNLGYLEKLSSPQFFDEKKGVFLNGRQVIGQCPIEGCGSEMGYADECSLGHQYMPSELIDPISSLSGEKPVLREIENWYFKLEDCIPLLKEWIDYLQKNTHTRQYVIKEIKEFLKAPEINIKREYFDDLKEIQEKLPNHEKIDEKNKASIKLIFSTLSDRENACKMLTEKGVRYRTGKTLVPFRLTGNCEWGVNAKELEGVKGLTFWVWPESLWAPISFTKTYLKGKGKGEEEWKKWWCSKDSTIYQVIGEDNIYFYGPAQHAMWLCLQGKNPSIDVSEGDLSISRLISNKHILFMNKKASSSSQVKPPMAAELLNYYTAEQLRSHFLGLGLGANSASFQPKVFDPDATEDMVDFTLKEGNLLTNVYNRTLRTLFYTWQKDFEGKIPFGTVSENIQKDCVQTILKYEKLMYENKFHMVSYELDSFIRNINKHWVKNINSIKNDLEKEKQIIIDTLHMAKVAMVLLHPIVPSGSERVAEWLGVSPTIFSWEKIDAPIYDFLDNPKNHTPKFLEPRVDFFKKHESQIISFDEE